MSCNKTTSIPDFLLRPGVVRAYHDSPISRLPTDILLEVFFSLQYEYRSDVGRKDWTSSVSWMRSLTHVCQFWRQWTIPSPLLWTYVVVGPLQVAQLFLERSNNLPLDVYCDITPRNYNEDLSAKTEGVVLCASRVRSLELRFPEEMDDIEPWNTLKFPLLARFVVSKPDSRWSAPPPPFLDTMTADDLPCLREVRITDFGLLSVTDPLIMARLTKLEICNGWEVDSLEDVMKLLAMLGGGPLENLSLVDTFPDALCAYFDANGPSEDEVPAKMPSFPYSISLPHLKRLRLVGAAVCCETVLRHAALPSDVAITMLFTADPDFGDLPRVLASIGRMLLQPSVPSLSEGAISVHIAEGCYHNGVAVSVWTRPLPRPSFYALSTPLPQANASPRLPDPLLQVNIVGYQPAVIAEALKCGFQTTAIRMFSFIGTPLRGTCQAGLGQPALSYVLASLSSIEVISISSQPTIEDISALLSPPLPGVSPTLWTVPQLKVLNVGPSTACLQTSTVPGESYISSLIDSLHARAAAGYGLELFRLPHDCLGTLNESQVERLKDCASVVHLTLRDGHDIILGTPLEEES